MKLYHTRHTKIKLEREQEERNGFYKMISTKSKLILGARITFNVINPSSL